MPETHIRLLVHSGPVDCPAILENPSWAETCTLYDQDVCDSPCLPDDGEVVADEFGPDDARRLEEAQEIVDGFAREQASPIWMKESPRLLENLED